MGETERLIAGETSTSFWVCTDASRGRWQRFRRRVASGRSHGC